MVYLYAGLGVAMLAGITAIFEMGLSLTGRSLLPIPADAYQENLAVKVNDRLLLRLLSSATDVPAGQSGALLCDSVRQAFVAQSGQDPWVDDSRMPVNTGRWVGSCVMNAGGHHVVILPTGESFEPAYQLYSCVLTPGADRCSFEQE